MRNKRGRSDAYGFMTVTQGQPAPDFTLPDQDGSSVSLASLGGQWAVVYFYPKDDTPGCTAESCSFRDSYEAFTDAGAKVVGISSDSVESHKACLLYTSDAADE